MFVCVNAPAALCIALDEEERAPVGPCVCVCVYVNSIESSRPENETVYLPMRSANKICAETALASELHFRNNRVALALSDAANAVTHICAHTHTHTALHRKYFD